MSVTREGLEDAPVASKVRPQFATMLTQHPQFAPATANTIWKELFGLGIANPVDSFDMARQDPKNPRAPWTVQPANPELLNALARDFAENRFSLKHPRREPSTWISSR